LLVIVAVGAVGGLLAHSLSSPIERLIVAAEQFEHGELDIRLKPTGARELRRLAMALNAMAERLQGSLDEMHTFVANASHELRTPLTTVKLRVEALRAGALEDPQVAPRFLSDIEDQVDRLSRMVNDLLDLSRLEGGIDAANRAPLDLGRIATEVRDVFRVRSEKSRLQVNLWVDPNLPPVLADEDQIWRVLMNLLDNAISYTPAEGRVDLRVVSLKDRGVVRLEVRDTGLGISPKDLPHIFERFYRTENTRQRKGRLQGSGIGLAIAKTIVENHGGKIGVNSRIGEGSLFWVDLPAVTRN
ncbi:MAG TPA: ATP-binding protein, partial [Anaerolineales bacterium]|nr:ATP-binding protein [Anaerolineales bacterium]